MSEGVGCTQARRTFHHKIAQSDACFVSAPIMQTDPQLLGSPHTGVPNLVGSPHAGTPNLVGSLQLDSDFQRRVFGFHAGDLLASLLLGWTHQHPDDLAASIDAAVSSLQTFEYIEPFPITSERSGALPSAIWQAVLLQTASTCDEATLGMKKPSSEGCKRRELRLVQNQSSITNPPAGAVRCRTLKEFQALSK
eukprot:362529-Chlamydomonas_euryale.AAC.4